MNKFSKGFEAKLKQKALNGFLSMIDEQAIIQFSEYLNQAGAQFKNSIPLHENESSAIGILEVFDGQLVVLVATIDQQNTIQRVLQKLTLSELVNKFKHQTNDLKKLSGKPGH